MKRKNCEFYRIKKEKGEHRETAEAWGVQHKEQLLSPPHLPGAPDPKNSGTNPGGGPPGRVAVGVPAAALGELARRPQLTTPHL